MKIKLWQFEYEFDKEDAKIVIPVLLLTLGLAFTPLNKTWLWSGATAYYGLYFFLKPSVLALKGAFARLRFRCPHCKSRDVFLQGFEGYHSDEHYGWYLCNHCGETSILIRDEKLIKPGPGRAKLKEIEKELESEK